MSSAVTQRIPDRRERVLDAVGPTWRRQKEVLAAAHVDTSTCLLILKNLVAEGVLEMRVESRTTSFGRPPHYYRRIA